MEEKTCGDTSIVTVDEEYGPIYCWQTRPLTLAEDDKRHFECVSVDRFPLKRHWCGFHLPKTDHSNHDQARMKRNYINGTKLICKVNGEGLMEYSDQNMEYFFFCQYIDQTVQRDSESVRKYLSRILLCDLHRSRCHQVPIPEHPDCVMVPHISVMDDDYHNRHVAVTKGFSDAGLKDTFFFAGSSGEGTEPMNTYPVVYAGFTEVGDMIGVYSVRVDT
jgi:hypothetical protein